MGIEFGDKSIVVCGLCLAVHARDEIVFFKGIADEAIRRLQFSDRDLGVKGAGDHQGHDPDKPGGWKAHTTCQKGPQGGGVVHVIDRWLLIVADEGIVAARREACQEIDVRREG